MEKEKDSSGNGRVREERPPEEPPRSSNQAPRTDHTQQRKAQWLAKYKGQEKGQEAPTAVSVVEPNSSGKEIPLSKTGSPTKSKPAKIPEKVIVPEIPASQSAAPSSSKATVNELNPIKLIVQPAIATKPVGFPETEMKPLHHHVTETSVVDRPVSVAIMNRQPQEVSVEKIPRRHVPDLRPNVNNFTANRPPAATKPVDIPGTTMKPMDYHATPSRHVDRHVPVAIMNRQPRKVPVEQTPRRHVLGLRPSVNNFIANRPPAATFPVGYPVTTMKPMDYHVTPSRSVDRAVDVAIMDRQPQKGPVEQIPRRHVPNLRPNVNNFKANRHPAGTNPVGFPLRATRPVVRPVPVAIMDRQPRRVHVEQIPRRDEPDLRPKFNLDEFYRTYFNKVKLNGEKQDRPNDPIPSSSKSWLPSSTFINQREAMWNKFRAAVLSDVPDEVRKKKWPFGTSGFTFIAFDDTVTTPVPSITQTKEQNPHPDFLETVLIEDPSYTETRPGFKLVTNMMGILSCSHRLRLNSPATVDFPADLRIFCPAPCAKRFNSCGHRCYKLCGEACGNCPLTTRRSYRCGHKAVVPCARVYTREDICRELVQSKVYSTCGHRVMIECHVQGKLRPEQVAELCNMPCDPYLTNKEESCGHPCTGRCKECRHARFHVRCSKPCGRTNICGHICVEPCSKACPPCNLVCELRCEHGRCEEECGYPCYPCDEPCVRECPHWKCGNKCGEVCDRPPCEEPCPKILPCGHPCISFCGDPCPNLCRICDQDKLAKGLLDFKELEPSDRFVLLPDCGHAIEREVMDQWMAVEQDQVCHKRCPLCGDIIYQCRRYIANLRSIHKDVRKVKEQTYGSSAAYFDVQKKIFDLLTTPPGSQLEEFPELKEYVSVVLPYDGVLKENVKYSNYNVPVMESTLEFTQIWIAAAGRLANLKKHVCPTLVMVVEELFKKTFQTMLERDPPLHSLERADLQRELNRCYDLAQLLDRRSDALPESVRHLSLTVAAQEAWKNAMEVIEFPGSYNVSIQKMFKIALAELDTAMHSDLGITEVERTSIIGAIGMRPGRWFKCPKGHVYLITECGGAMQRRRCPEPGCGAIIGGMNHRLEAGNRLATEMDGALFPAYSNRGYNMNIQNNQFG